MKKIDFTKSTISVLIVAIFLVVISGCSNEASTVKVGLIVPLTGDQAVWGNDVKNSAELCVEKFNELGGMNGKNVELVVYDDKGDPTEAINAYNRLYSSDKVVGIIGPVSSGCSFSVAEASAKDKMPIITGTATHPDVTTYGDNFFRACFEDPFQGKAVAKFAYNELSAKTAAIIYDNSKSYSLGLKDSINSQAKEIGLSIVATESYGKDDVDFNAQLTKIISKNPDVLFVPDYYNNVYLVCKQARDLGYKGVFVSTDAVDGILELDGIDANVLDGLYFSGHYATDDTSEIVTDYISTYKNKFGNIPNSIAALGYDATLIMLDALKRADIKGVQLGNNKESFNAVLEALWETDIDCITGHITFDINGNPIKICKIMKIINGETHYYMDY